MSENRIIVIDDEANVGETIRVALEGQGFSVNCYQNPEEALEGVRRLKPDLIVTDLVMPELDGLEVIRRAKTLNPETNVLVITAHASLESAVGAIRAGASDYLMKPFKIDDLTNAVNKALAQTRLPPEAAAQGKEFLSRYKTKNLIGRTPEMREIFKLIEKVAKSDSSVLIIGESGTGKEMIARAIHYHSKRRRGPFVSINCAALPETLLESELFGYEKGAFTGASAVKAGLFELAKDGTFLLDEVGEMSTHLQAKLLRVLQERTLKRLGGVRDIATSFRLIAATSRDLPEDIKDGRFREDLFYRLNVIPIFIPSLRERSDDIPIFVYYFLGMFAARDGTGRQFRVEPEAMEVFQSHDWPGNVRELENVIERLLALADSDSIDGAAARKAIERGQFSRRPRTAVPSVGDLKGSVEQHERRLIEEALAESKGNKNQAAKKLNLTRQGLQYKLEKLGIK